MRLIDADELIEHVWRDRLHTRELIAQMIENAPTVKTEKTPKEIEQQIHEFAEKMYQAGYADGKKEAITYEKAIDFLDETGWKDAHDKEMMEYGMEMAWECAKKLALMSSDNGFDNKTVKEIFGTTNCYSIFEKMSVSTVVTKIKDYEEQQKQTDAEIRVGDEVYSHLGEIPRCVVIRIYKYDDAVASLLSQDGKWAVMELSNLHKTGKHYSQIEEVLKELRGDEE